MEKIFQFEFAGRPLIVETGKLAQLANGSALIRYGDTVVMCTATMSAKPREGIDFFPLSVDYEEKLYSVGKIPGSFQKREGKPSEKAILTSRVIDRPIRPLFPKDLRNDVTVISTVMSVDQDNQPEFAAMFGSAVSIGISNIPFNGPIASVIIGMVDGEFVLNPNAEQREKSILNLTVAGTKEKVVMIEAGAKEVNDDDMYNAILFGHEHVKTLCGFIDQIVSEIGKEKIPYESHQVNEEIYNDIKENFTDALKQALDTDDKKVRDEALAVVYAEFAEKFGEKYPEMEDDISEAFEKYQKYIVRRWILDEGKRVDGRKIDQIRPLASEVGILPRVHGSGLFTRGQTQVLTAATLGALGDVQKLDGIDDDLSLIHISEPTRP